MDNNIYQIACATDDNYVQHCAVMLCSLFENNRNMRFCIHVMSESLISYNLEQLKSLVERYKSSFVFHKITSEHKKILTFQCENPIAEPAYYRLLLPTLLDDSIAEILYLDVDLVILRSIRSLFQIGLNGFSAAAVSDNCLTDDSHRLIVGHSYNDRYFNSGVIFINLQYWRNKHVQKEALAYMANQQTKLHDQDVLNAVLRDTWFELAPKWNRMSLKPMKRNFFKYPFDKKEYYKSPIVFHYANWPTKPWYNQWVPFQNYYKKYLVLSLWKNAIMIRPRCKILHFRFLIFKWIIKEFLFKHFL